MLIALYGIVFLFLQLKEYGISDTKYDWVITLDKFILAKKPPNYISEHFLQFRKEKLFPSLSSN